MEHSNLTTNGIQQLLAGRPSVLQICQIRTKVQGEEKFTLSDGFCKVNRCLILSDAPKKEAVKLYDVVRFDNTTVNKKAGKVVYVLVEQYKVIRDDLDSLIGCSIPLEQFQNANKINKAGSNKIPQKGKGKKLVDTDYQSVFQDDDQQCDQNYTNKVSVRNKKNQQAIKKVEKGKVREEEQTDQTCKRKPQFVDPGFTPVSHLYEGIQDWKIKVRIIFCSKLKSFVRKKDGQQSFVFGFEACDNSGTLQLTAFGDNAQSYSDVIKIDQVFTFERGKVEMDKSTASPRIILNEKTLINMMEDNKSLSTVAEFCLTPSQLIKKNIGQTFKVVALVRDDQNVLDFTSKNGNLCRKKDIFLCDPVAKIQLKLTLWFESADIRFNTTPYAFSGITVTSFNDQKQYQTSIKFSFRPLLQHHFSKYSESFQEISMENPNDQDHGSNKFSNKIQDLHQLKQKAEQSQVGQPPHMLRKIFHLVSISHNSQNVYMSCPACKKKVADETNGKCPNPRCNNEYSKAKYRYILNLQICDQSDSIWATAYDDTAQIILSIDNDIRLTANDYREFTEEQLKEHIQRIQDKAIQVTVIAKKQQYQGQQKLKYSLAKASAEIEYGLQSRNALKSVSQQMQKY